MAITAQSSLASCLLYTSGELHLSVLIENMRREGYEFAVSKAEVLYKTDENGKKLEPMELCYIDVPVSYTHLDVYKRQVS